MLAGAPPRATAQLTELLVGTNTIVLGLTTGSGTNAAMLLTNLVQTAVTNTTTNLDNASVQLGTNTAGSLAWMTGSREILVQSPNLLSGRLRAQTVISNAGGILMGNNALAYADILFGFFLPDDALITTEWQFNGSGNTNQGALAVGESQSAEGYWRVGVLTNGGDAFAVTNQLSAGLALPFQTNYSSNFFLPAGQASVILGQLYSLISRSATLSNTTGSSTNGLFTEIGFNVRVRPRPQAAVTRAGTNLALSWPSNQAGVVIETTTNLSQPASWVVTNLPPVTNQGFITVHFPFVGTNRYFRLRW